MNNQNPPENLPNEDQKVQAPKDGPQSLPQEELLSSPDQGLTDPDEHMKRIEREGEINKVAPEPPNNIGPDTTGVGQPTAQPVNQGQSLPQSSLPVDNKFDGKTAEFYDPNATEVAKQLKDRAARGGMKTEHLEDEGE